jgi:hypothetical protein
MASVALGPAPLDITGIRAGDRNEFGITLTSNNAPLNLTGYTVTAQARNTHADVDMVAAVVTITSATNGQLTLRWPGDLIRTWLATKIRATGVWDMQIKPAAGDPITVAAGAFTAEMDVTRP